MESERTLQSLPPTVIIDILNQTDSVDTVVNMCLTRKGWRNLCLKDSTKKLLKFKLPDFTNYARRLLGKERLLSHDLQSLHFLLDYGVIADPSFVNAINAHALRDDLSTLSDADIRFYLSFGIDPDELFIRAIKSRNENLYPALLEKISDVNYVNPKTGMTFLMVAIQNYQADLVHRLLERGADPHYISGGMTPLERAAADTKPNEQIILDLIMHDAVYDFSLFYKAVYHNMVRLVHYLIERGVDVNRPNKSGTLPLDLALDNNNYEVAQLLIQYGATSLHRSGEFLQSLLEIQLPSTCLPLTPPKEKSFSPLIKAIIKRDPHLVQQILENGADPNEFTSAGRTPLFYAIDQDHPEIVRILLLYDANPHIPNSQGVPPLRYAIERCQRNAVHALLSWE